jgi:hypothetical protein
MRIAIATEPMPEELTQEGWQLYNEAFDELRSSAVQRHVMHLEEFEETMRDPRILKYMGFDSEDRMRGLATYTNALEAIHLISPEYFQRRWPREFEARRIWYVGFVGIHPEHRHSGLYEALIREMVDTHGGHDCIVGVDVCRRNEELGFPEGTHRLVSELYGDVKTGRMDAQSYWYYDFSDAAPRQHRSRSPAVNLPQIVATGG